MHLPMWAMNFNTCLSSIQISDKLHFGHFSLCFFVCSPMLHESGYMSWGLGRKDMQGICLLFSIFLLSDLDSSYSILASYNYKFWLCGPMIAESSFQFQGYQNPISAASSLCYCKLACAEGNSGYILSSPSLQDIGCLGPTFFWCFNFLFWCFLLVHFISSSLCQLCWFAKLLYHSQKLKASRAYVLSKSIFLSDSKFLNLSTPAKLNVWFSCKYAHIW